MTCRLRLTACIFVLTGSAFAGTIIHVPADQPTIQAGINAASNGDIVLVAPGTYSESINFNGKAITVGSSNGASVTTIAIPSASVGVTFNHGEMNSSVFKGFTIQGGAYTVGIIASASPKILNNVITGNHNCGGAGINVNWASPIIKGNKITGNFADMCTNGSGGGIYVGGQGSAQIIGNFISGNGGTGLGGGAIELYAAGSPYIANNTIMNNVGASGGAIGIEACCSDAVIVQNLIIGNTAAEQGGGIGISIFGNSGAPTVVNNTFVNNQTNTGMGSAVYTNNSSGNPTKFYNNIIVGVSGETTLYCGNFNTSTLPTIAFNDVYAPSGTRYGGICTDETGTNGNISADPQFVSRSNLRLKGGSPTIDAGSNAAPHLPAKDFAGNTRIINGNGGSTAVVDMGAYEFVPVVLAPKGLNFGLQAAGSTTSNTVKLTNAQNKTLNISSYSVPTGYAVAGCGTSVAAFTSCKLTVTFHPLISGTFKGVLSVKDDAGNSPQTVSLAGSAQ